MSDLEIPQPSPWSCFSCRRRKYRCDRRAPCTNCHKSGYECAYPTSGRLPTRQSDPSSGLLGSVRRRREHELLGRLRQLEEIVDELRSLESSPGSVGMQSKSTYTPGQDACENGENTKLVEQAAGTVDEMSQELGKLVLGPGGGCYVEDRIWSRISDKVTLIRLSFAEVEFHHLQPQMEHQDRTLQEQERFPPLFAASSGFNESTVSLQPLPSQVSFIWQIYVDNVDPFVRVLHKPTITKIIKDCNGRINQLAPEMQSLMFAIAFAAISTLGDNEVYENFGDTKQNLISRYKTGTEKAISRAGVMTTFSLTVVQAFLIYLEMVERGCGSRVIWTVTGMLVRIAISMGLHKDGSHFPDISPFEREMRRRLWWHICFLDARVGDCEVSHTSISEDIFDTKQPANMDDADMSPHMLELPSSRAGYTDMTECLVHCQVWQLGQYFQKTAGPFRLRTDRRILQARAGNLKRLEEARLEMIKNHAQYLDPSRPLHSCTASTATLMLAKMEMSMLELGGPGDQDRSNGVRSLLLALATLELFYGPKTRGSAGQFSWLTDNGMVWLALGVLLSRLTTLAWGPTCERAWRVAQTSLQRMTGVSPKRADQLHSIDTLVDLVRSYREQEILRLQSQPAICRQLQHLFDTQTVFTSEAFAPINIIGFDLTEAQRNISLEVDVSRGDANVLIGSRANTLSKEGPCMQWLHAAGPADRDLDLSNPVIGIDDITPEVPPEAFDFDFIDLQPSLFDDIDTSIPDTFLWS